MRLESSVTPKILMLPANLISVSATLTEVRLDTDLSLWDVPKRIASDLVGLSAIPFSQNQAWTEVRQGWSVVMLSQ